MNKQKALELIKTVIDQSIKGGLIQNLETTQAISQAFNIISNELQDKNEVITDAQ